jgi:hypothetical protein
MATINISKIIKVELPVIYWMPLLRDASGLRHDHRPEVSTASCPLTLQTLPLRPRSSQSVQQGLRCAMTRNAIVSQTTVQLFMAAALISQKRS